MKVLFLDHDGVICLSTEWGGRFKNREGFDSQFDRFNKKAIGVLNEIIAETDCEIVVSSDWAIYIELKDMKRLYKERGVIKSPIAYTESLKGISLEETRANEIKLYVDKHSDEIESWVAVDDLPMAVFLNGNFVWTPISNEGIKQSGVKNRIIKILNS